MSGVTGVVGVSGCSNSLNESKSASSWLSIDWFKTLLATFLVDDGGDFMPDPRGEAVGVEVLSVLNLFTGVPGKLGFVLSTPEQIMIELSLYSPNLATIGLTKSVTVCTTIVRSNVLALARDLPALQGDLEANIPLRQDASVRANDHPHLLRVNEHVRDETQVRLDQHNH